MVCVRLLYWGAGNSNCDAVLAEKSWQAIKRCQPKKRLASLGIYEMYHALLVNVTP